MPRKEEIFKQLDLSTKTTYTKGEVKSFVTSVTVRGSNMSRIKRGDVFVDVGSSKNRPHVVVGFYKDVVVAIPMSTTKDGLNVCEYNSRFFGNGYLSASFRVAKKRIYC